MTEAVIDPPNPAEGSAVKVDPPPPDPKKTVEGPPPGPPPPPHTVPYGEYKEERGKRQAEKQRRIEAENRARDFEARLKEMEARNPPPPRASEKFTSLYPDDPASEVVTHLDGEVSDLRKTVSELQAERDQRQVQEGQEWYSEFSGDMEKKYGFTGVFKANEDGSSKWRDFLREANGIVNFNNPDTVDEQIEALFRSRHLDALLARERDEAIKKHEEAKREALGPSPTMTGASIPAIARHSDLTKAVLERLARESVR